MLTFLIGAWMVGFAWLFRKPSPQAQLPMGKGEAAMLLLYPITVPFVIVGFVLLLLVCRDLWRTIERMARIMAGERA